MADFVFAKCSSYGFTPKKHLIISASKELTIIDGQRRLTTLTLIYLALYSLAKDLKDIGLESEISETYLINRFAPEEEKLKLRFSGFSSCLSSLV